MCETDRREKKGLDDPERVKEMYMYVQNSRHETRPICVSLVFAFVVGLILYFTEILFSFQQERQLKDKHRAKAHFKSTQLLTRQLPILIEMETKYKQY